MAMAELSHTALKAFDERYELLGPLEEDWQESCLAAVFRALANHPHEDSPWWLNQLIRRELRNLAHELEAENVS